MFLKVLKHPLKAKALYLVVFITFIISVILLLFISSSYYTQVEVLHYEKLKNLVDANNSLIHFSLDTEEKENYSNWKEVELFENTEIQTELLIEEWGVIQFQEAGPNGATGNTLRQHLQEISYLKKKILDFTWQIMENIYL